MLLVKSRIYEKKFFNFETMTYLELLRGKFDIYIRKKNAIFYECSGCYQNLGITNICRAINRANSIQLYMHIDHRESPKKVHRTFNSETSHKIFFNFSNNKDGFYGT